MPEIVWLGRDNPVHLQLQSDGASIDHTAITRLVVVLGGTSLDSQTNPSWFDFSNIERVILKFGQSGVAAGAYRARLIVYDDAHPNGQTWGAMPVELLFKSP